MGKKDSSKQKGVQFTKEQLKKEIQKIVDKKAKTERFWKKNNFWMVVLTTAIVVSGFLTFSSMNKQTQAIEGSYLPQAYISGWHCPDKLEEDISIPLNIGIANYGKIPTQFSWKWSYQNVNITQLKNGNKDEIEKQGMVYILVPIEYKDNEQFNFDVENSNVELTNSALDSAEFKLNYFYLKKERKRLKDNVISQSFFCEYKKENGVFNLVKSNNFEKILAYSVELK